MKRPICKINDGMRERKISRDTDKSRQPLIKSSDFFKQEIIRKQISLLKFRLSHPVTAFIIEGDGRVRVSMRFFSYCHRIVVDPHTMDARRTDDHLKAPRLQPHIPIKIPVIRSYFYFQAPPKRVNHVKGMTGNPGRT